MKSEKTAIVAGFTLITLIWGSTWLAIKIGLESIPPFYGVALRFTIALILLGFIMRLRNQEMPLDKDSVLLYFVLGLFSFSIPFALVYWGEQHIPSGLASILFAVYPFVVAVISHFGLPNERLNLYKFFGIGWGFCGVVLIFWEDIHVGEIGTQGMFAIILSTIFQGFSLVYVKRKGKYIRPVSMNFGGMAIGVLVVYILAFVSEDFSQIRFDLKGIGSLIYLGTCGSVLTFVVYYWLLIRIEAVYMSLIALVTPVIAVILGAIWYGESLSPKIAIGASMVLLGIFIANGKDFIQMIYKSKSHLVTK